MDLFILLSKLPPTSRLHGVLLSALEEHYKVISYADDLKPAVTSMNESILVDQASTLFEGASGCRLHRNPASQKYKFLPLGKWRKSP